MLVPVLPIHKCNYIVKYSGLKKKGKKILRQSKSNNGNPIVPPSQRWHKESSDSKVTRLRSETRCSEQVPSA